MYLFLLSPMLYISSGGIRVLRVAISEILLLGSAAHRNRHQSMKLSLAMTSRHLRYSSTASFVSTNFGMMISSSSSLVVCLFIFFMMDLRFRSSMLTFAQ